MLQETSTSFLYGLEYNFEGGKQLIPGFDTTQSAQDNAKQIMTFSSTIDPCTTGLLGKRRQEGWNTLKKDFFCVLGFMIWHVMLMGWLLVMFDSLFWNHVRVLWIIYWCFRPQLNLLIFSLLSLCQSFLMMVVPRWHAYMLNPKTCGNFVESWIARLKQTGQDQLMLGEGPAIPGKTLRCRIGMQSRKCSPSPPLAGCSRLYHQAIGSLRASCIDILLHATLFLWLVHCLTMSCWTFIVSPVCGKEASLKS